MLSQTARKWLNLRYNEIFISRKGGMHLLYWVDPCIIHRSWTKTLEKWNGAEELGSAILTGVEVKAHRVE